MRREYRFPASCCGGLELLAVTQPGLVTVMVGVNDFWTKPVPVAGEEASLGGVLWRYSRVYRLVYMLERLRHGSTVQVTVERAAPDGSARRVVRYADMEIEQVRVPKAPVDDWPEALAQNLVR